MKNSNTAVRFWILICAPFLALNLACTRDMGEQSTLKLKMPDSLSSSEVSAKAVFTQSAGGPPWNGGLNPSTLSDIDCYAVFVGGPDPRMSRNTCTSALVGDKTVMRFGPALGFVPASGTVEINIPAVSEARIWIVGTVSGDGTCPAFNDLKDATFANLSYPHILATKDIKVVPGDNEVNIEVALDPANAFDKCDFIDDSGNGGGGGNTLADLYGDGEDGSFTFNGAIIDLDVDTFAASGVSRVDGTRGASTKIFSANHRITALSADRTTVDLGTSLTADDYEVGDEVFWHVSAGFSYSTGPDVQPANNTSPELIKGACGGGLYIGSHGSAKVTSVSGTTLQLDDEVGDSSIPLSDRDGNGSPPYNISHVAPTGGLPGDDTQNFCIVQLRRVPQIDVLTVNGAGPSRIKSNAITNFSYSAGTGGIIVMRIKKLELDSRDLQVNTYARGFGGISDNGGTGYGGQFDVNNLSWTNSNGGGGTFSGSGAGGGSSAGAGGNGSSAPISGAPAITNCSGPCQIVRDQKFFIGGAGGGMGGPTGGAGGGAVFLHIGEVKTVSGTTDDGSLDL
ncbi:MAG: hypothetical protein HRT45_18980, partial [Bdellovibrionales bacterium]|nr:hypothetical protein [Bdellovibrionales bacterium]